ncbi:unnamed protein product [Protopolystoma xenopodis]|uniref:Uncharacterized protein n=1 Tax=Protopolystoma xenopodis TaxID=117903 RepID=A0A448WMV8_9PLAT|nr:unnamed protein product [Protopolystoma xenopodis]
MVRQQAHGIRSRHQRYGSCSEDLQHQNQCQERQAYGGRQHNQHQYQRLGCRGLAVTVVFILLVLYVLCFFISLSQNHVCLSDV